MAIEMIAGIDVVPEREKREDTNSRAIEKAIRRIVRAHDLQSKALAKASGLTAAQLVVMKGVFELGEVTSAALSAYADISAATAVTVLDNLEERGLIQRYRSDSDRRVVHTKLTESGLATLTTAPTPLGELFLQRLSRLSEEQRQLVVEAAIALADLLSGDSKETLHLPGRRRSLP